MTIARHQPKTVRRVTSIYNLTDLGRACQLTNQEWKVLEQIAMGRTTKEGASAIGLSSRGFEYHVARIYRKFGYSNHVELAKFAIRINLVEP